jgi:hypothetical protein
MDSFVARTAAVQRFRELLRSCPLVAVVSESRLIIRAVQLTADKRRLVHNNRWEMLHWKEFSEAVDLFWTDPVQAWLAAHPCAEVGVHFRNMDAQEIRAGSLLVVDSS